MAIDVGPSGLANMGVRVTGRSNSIEGDPGGLFDEASNFFNLAQGRSPVWDRIRLFGPGVSGQAGSAPLVAVPPVPGAILLFASGLVGLLGIVASRENSIGLKASKGPLTVDSGNGPWSRTKAFVVLVTGDASFADEILKNLNHAGYVTRQASCAADVCVIATRHRVSLVLVDRRVDGWEMLGTDPMLHRVPMITVVPPGSHCREEECLRDLDCGIDSYHFCQEGYRLLLAKVTSFIRRAGFSTKERSVYRVGALEMDTDRHTVMLGHRRIDLPPTQFAILKLLMRHPSKVFSRRRLLDHIWGPGFAVDGHTLDVHIHRLRRQIERDPAHPCHLVAIKGVGFKLKDALSAPSGADSSALREVSTVSAQRAGDVVSRISSSRVRRRTWITQPRSRPAYFEGGSVVKRATRPHRLRPIQSIAGAGRVV
jgi:two-component system response regulator RegX3